VRRSRLCPPTLTRRGFVESVVSQHAQQVATGLASRLRSCTGGASCPGRFRHRADRMLVRISEDVSDRHSVRSRKIPKRTFNPFARQCARVDDQIIEQCRSCSRRREHISFLPINVASVMFCRLLFRPSWPGPVSTHTNDDRLTPEASRPAHACAPLPTSRPNNAGASPPRDASERPTICRSTPAHASRATPITRRRRYPVPVHPRRSTEPGRQPFKCFSI